ncbi:MAG: MEKHLA domain-containing protein [Snowella sp.]|nr:MEKHLA domain-containing protein [Snowella sp.]
MNQLSFPEPCAENAYLAEHIHLMQESLRQSTKRDFTDCGLKITANLAKDIYYAPFVVVSHNTDPDPIFNYANLTAQKLFEMTWQEFTALPSRQSAEPPNQDERAQLLETVATKGFCENYTGIRISKNQRRFYIQDALVWNLVDLAQKYYGQAAICHRWQYL